MPFYLSGFLLITNEMTAYARLRSYAAINVVHFCMFCMSCMSCMFVMLDIVGMDGMDGWHGMMALDWWHGLVDGTLGTLGIFGHQKRL